MPRYILIIFLILLSCSKEVTSQKDSVSIHIQFITDVKLPEKLELCGEEIPLDDPEVRERAEREFYMLIQQPGQIILYLKRAGRFFPMFDQIINENKMPADLKYLSVAESALYMARSAKDAVGMWQFMEATAKTMGLLVDEFVDERRHPEKSTRAAMKYLREGYQVNKSWLLTLAGYNMGHENITSSLQFQTVDNYFDLFLNEETSRFIFRIAIIKEIMENPSKYGFNLGSDEIYKPYKIKKEKVFESIQNLPSWSKSHGASYKDVKVLNPWILKTNLPKPAKGFYEIYLPD